MTYETTEEIETAVARHLGWRTHIIVPNISWGANVHECDLFVVSKSGYATEVEIKISAADLKKDALKRHGHRSDKIRYLYFAIPKKLIKHWKHIPARAGVYVIDHKGGVHVLRKPQRNKVARRLTEKEIANISRLGVMRYWSQRGGASVLKVEVNSLKKLLGADHKVNVFNIRYHRDQIKDLKAIPEDDRTRDYLWSKNYHEEKMMEAVNAL